MNIVITARLCPYLGATSPFYFWRVAMTWQATWPGGDDVMTWHPLHAFRGEGRYAVRDRAPSLQWLAVTLRSLAVSLQDSLEIGLQAGCTGVCYF